MKMGGADYSNAELPEGVVEQLDCMNGHGPMEYIGKGLFVCYECRTVGTALAAMTEVDTRPLPKERPVEVLLRSARPSLAPMKIFPSTKEGYEAAIEHAKPRPADEEHCTPATHRWSKPSVKIVTIERTAVKCEHCGMQVQTDKQGSRQEIMADLMSQIPLSGWDQGGDFGPKNGKEEHGDG